MPAFAYQAVDAAGKRVKGQAEAQTPELLVRSLADRGVVVVNVTETEAAPKGFGFRFGRHQGVLEATRALGALLPAGGAEPSACQPCATVGAREPAPALSLGIRNPVRASPMTM